MSTLADEQKYYFENTNDECQHSKV